MEMLYGSVAVLYVLSLVAAYKYNTRYSFEERIQKLKSLV
jgi:hypothetical protein